MFIVCTLETIYQKKKIIIFNRKNVRGYLENIYSFQHNNIFYGQNVFISMSENFKRILRNHLL